MSLLCKKKVKGVLNKSTLADLCNIQPGKNFSGKIVTKDDPNPNNEHF